MMTENVDTSMADGFRSLDPPLISHTNRETFAINGKLYLSSPSIEELLVECGIVNVRIFRAMMRDLSTMGVETVDDLFDFSKSKFLHLESFSDQNTNKLVNHLMKLKHKGSILLSGDQLELLEEKYFYLEFVKEIDTHIFKHANGKVGLRSQSVIEICGPDGVGKTQWCLTATCSMLQVGKKVIYIDSEDGFNYSRIKQIAVQSELSQRSIKDNVLLSRIDSFDELDWLLKEISLTLKQNNVGMIIIDSLMTLLQNTYPVTIDRDWDNIAVRQLHLRRTMRRLRSMARTYNLIVLYTNHTLEGKYLIPLVINEEIPEEDGEDLKALTNLIKRLIYYQRPMGGPTIAHSSDMRIYLTADVENQSKMLATIENCPYLPRSSLDYIITSNGINMYENGKRELHKTHIDNINNSLS